MKKINEVKIGSPLQSRELNTSIYIQLLFVNVEIILTDVILQLILLFLIRIVKIIYLLWNRSKYDQDIYYVLK